MKNRWQNINTDSGEKTWLTPKHIIDALGHFDTDPCCPPNMPWRTADRMLTKEDDGTTAPWVGRVWLNPPYGREARPFLERMARHEGGGCVLVFSRTDNSQWQDLIFPFAHSVMFLRGRVRFCKVDGKECGSGMPTGSALIAYSPADTDALAKSGLRGTLVRLRK